MYFLYIPLTSEQATVITNGGSTSTRHMTGAQEQAVQDTHKTEASIKLIDSSGRGLAEKNQGTKLTIQLISVYAHLILWIQISNWPISYLMQNNFELYTTLKIIENCT